MTVRGYCTFLTTFSLMRVFHHSATQRNVTQSPQPQCRSHWLNVNGVRIGRVRLRRWGKIKVVSICLRSAASAVDRRYIKYNLTLVSRNKIELFVSKKFYSEGCQTCHILFQTYYNACIWCICINLFLILLPYIGIFSYIWCTLCFKQSSPFCLHYN